PGPPVPRAVRRGAWPAVAREPPRQLLPLRQQLDLRPASRRGVRAGDQPDRALPRRGGPDRGDAARVDERAARGPGGPVPPGASARRQDRPVRRAPEITLSVVVPVYNERAGIGGALRAAAAAIERSPFRAEFVVVDD